MGTFGTFGIALPWMICMMCRFVINHMVIDGKRLRFVGTGGSLIGNYLKWWILTVINLWLYSSSKNYFWGNTKN